MAKTPLRFGRAGHLLGIVHEAKAETPSQWGILLWNTGISNRTGPFGLNVALAERLSQRGHTVLRFDLSRLGDSTDAGETISVQERSNRDLADAVELLSQRYGMQQFLLIGICSSAVDAFYYARLDPRISAMIMVDTFVYETKAHRWRYLWHRLKDPRRWLRFIQRRLPGQKVSLPAAPDYFDSNYPHRDEARAGVEQLLARGSSLLVLYTGGFHAYFSHPSQFHTMLNAPAFQGDLEIHHWPKADHLFSILEERERFFTLVDTWVTRVLESRRGEPRLAAPRRESEPLAQTADDKRRHKVEYFAPGESPILALTSPAAEDASLAALSARVLEVFQKVLYPADFTEPDSFFEFGGTSVLAIKAAAILSEEFQLPVSVLWIYEAPRAAELGRKLFEAQREQAQQPITAAAAPAEESRPLSDSLDEGIAIIGIACHVPGAKTWQEFWQNVCDGKETITRFKPEELDPSIPLAMRQHPNYVPARGVIEGDRFDHQFFKISAREAAFADPQQRILLETCWQALEDAGYIQERSKLPIAVYAGTSNSTYMTRNIMSGHATAFSEEEFLATLWNDKDFPATRIAHALDLRGPAISLHTACSTSLVAVIEAIKALRSGDAAIALAGGCAVEAPMASGHLYQEGSIFSRDGHCRPFAADASGTLFSDGSAVVVLRPLKAALEAGDHIYAVLRGWGVNNDGADKTSFAAPSIRGQAIAIREAYRKAQWSPSSVGFIEAHGTGTPIGDPIEVEALRRTFYELEPKLKQQKASCALGSVKALVGHLTAAAGTIGLIKAALAIAEGKIPPQPLGGPENKELRLDQSPFYIPTRLSPWSSPQRRAAVSSFGVGGTNAHVLLEQAPPRAAHPAEAAREASSLKALDPWLIVPWSAQDAASCERLGQAIGRALPAQGKDPERFAGNLRRYRASFPWKQTLIAWDHASLASLSAHVPKPLQRPSQRPQKSSPLIWLFAGQGSQYPALGSRLAQIWPRFAQHYQRCLTLFAKAGLNELPPLMLGTATQPQKIHETLYTQAALFTFQWALGQSLLELGLPIQGAIGHSIGEYAAACLAGVFQLEDAITLVTARAQAMDAAAPGMMLAVRSDWESLKERLPPEVALAAVNAPRSIVLAGPMAAIEQARGICKELSLATRPLETSKAFHSPMMEPILAQFAEAFRSIVLRPAAFPLISSVDGQVLRAERIQSSDYWVHQLRQPVQFAEAIRTADRQDPLYLDLGPRDTLSKLLPAILGPKESLRSIPLSKDGILEQEANHLVQGLGLLWSMGHTWNVPQVKEKMPVPVYPFYGESFWLAPKTLPLQQGKTMQPSREHSSSPTRPSSTLQRLRALLSELSGHAPEALRQDASWNDLGMDSLLMTQWALKLQREWTVPIKMQELQSSIPNLAGLEEYLYRQRPELKLAHSSELADEELYRSSNLNHTPELPGLSENWPSMAQVFQQQIQIMQQQLELMARWSGMPSPHPLTTSSLSTPSPTSPTRTSPTGNDRASDVLHSLGEPQWQTIYTDEGPKQVPLWSSSQLMLDGEGRVQVLIEDPEHPGKYYQS